MNLVKDPWLPFRLRSGEEAVLPISAICDPDVVDFALPRADFQGAAYQFAIGLLQTVFAPDDRFDWKDLYIKPPSRDELQSAFNKAEHAFNMMGKGPLFMQEYENLPTVKPVEIDNLLAEAPGAHTIELNKDHFVKRARVEMLSLPMAAMALFTYQINGQPVTGGYRAGLRKSGPLTTLLCPQGTTESLWQKVWLNILDRDEWRYPEVDLKSPSIFPWLAPTKTSVPGEVDSEIYQHQVHPLCVYWAMPQRVNLETTEGDGHCGLTGDNIKVGISHYYREKYGHWYVGSWDHPLTPYNSNPQKPEEAKTPITASYEAVTYKYWNSLSFDSDKYGFHRASVIGGYWQKRAQLKGLLRETPRIWAFGYHMEQGQKKTHGWYSTQLPLFELDYDVQDDILFIVQDMLQLAEACLIQCRKQIQNAWFVSPAKSDDKQKKVKLPKGDFSFIDLAFWQRTEAQFFKTVQSVIDNSIDGNPDLTPEQADDWLKALRSVVTDIFDEYALTELGSERSTAKRIKARRALSGWLYGGKQIKNFINENQIDSLKEAD